MQISRVAVVYDDRPRPETTGMYCFRAWSQLAETVHLRPHELEGIRPGQFDLILHVDDGMPRECPEGLGLTAFWAIDTHLDFERCQGIARRCDLVFAAQREGAERLRKNGIESAQWLPLACDPEIHGRRDVPPRYDVAFVGHDFPGPRGELLQILRDKFPHSFLGTCDFREMADVYSAARIVFNRSIRNDLNMRVFEGLASGALVITNELDDNGQAELFQEGVYLVTYREVDDLLEKISYYLEHEAARTEIGTAGRELVLARHTYRQRMQQIREAVSCWPEPTTPAIHGYAKDHAYFDFARPELLNLIPQEARRVLDIGCGGGALGDALKQRQPVEVWGIEREADVAERARQRLDRVLIGDVEQLTETLPTGTFDTVICGDVLEHLRHPERLLKQIRAWLKSDGQLIASLPNVRHHSVLAGLLHGDWTYEPAGLLDEDHVRFFTRREIEKLLFRTGFMVNSWQRVLGPGDQLPSQGEPVRIGPLSIAGLCPAEVADYHTYQYLVSARPGHALGRHGMTSIILVTHNQLPYTRGCLESIRFRTDEAYELIVVDNGSTDGTVPYLREQPDVRLIVNSENRGFPAAVNQGLAVAHGRQIVLLNNDTLVTTGWLTRMLHTLNSNPHIGLVGPVSNRVSGEQQIAVDYHNLSQLDGFAWEWGNRHAGQRVVTDRLVGFCLLLSRELWERLGPLDERFGIGNFEDDDYCRRARGAGYQCVIAVDAFVHHFGSVTFQASGVDFAGLLRENQQKYSEKWESTEPRPSAARREPVDPAISPPHSLEGEDVHITISPDGALQLPTDRPRLSLCMIVRDNERTLDPCLASISPWVDELIVVDTGSVDRTPEIALQYGAKLYHFPWCDDFAAARNESLKHATGDWLFWMDSDDVIPEECGRKLRELAQRAHPPHVLGYVMQVHCPGKDPHDVTVVDHVKLFRNRPGLRFEFRIHEQILPAIRCAGGDVEFTDIYVVHAGSEHTPESRARKLERDFRILHLEEKEKPQHPFVLFNLGMTYADAERGDDAIRYLSRCIEVSHPEESHVRKAYALLIGVYCREERWEEARRTCDRGRQHFRDDKELLFRAGLLHQHAQEWERAEHVYRQVLEQSEHRHFTSVDQGLADHKTRHNLALVYESQGRWEEAINQWRSIVEQRPDYRLAWSGWAEILLQQGMWADISSLLDVLNQQPGLAPVGRLIEARLKLRLGNVEEAQAMLENAVRIWPDETELLQEWCRVVFECRGPLAARLPLEKLTKLVPDDPAAWHNLAAARLEFGDRMGAQIACEQSLKLRVNSPLTEKLLTAIRNRT